MRRWHVEREIMLRRWRNEIADHGGHSGWRLNGWTGNSWLEAPVPPPACDLDTCHCFRGVGYFRKRKPFDCGSPQCGLCHYGKWIHNRQNERRAAIEFELRAYE